MKWMIPGVVASVALAFAAQEAEAARYYCRSSACYVGTPSTSYGTGGYCHDNYCKERDCPPVTPPVVVTYRQCKVIYFDACSSAWYEADALVVADYAVAGVLVHDAKIPRVGCVKAWIKEVYEKPHLLPPANRAARFGATDCRPGAGPSVCNRRALVPHSVDEIQLGTWSGASPSVVAISLARRGLRRRSARFPVGPTLDLSRSACESRGRPPLQE